jgi:hypothetical protein
MFYVLFNAQYLRPFQRLHDRISRHKCIWVCEWTGPRQDVVEVLPIPRQWLGTEKLHGCSRTISLEGEPPSLKLRSERRPTLFE